MSDSPDFFVTLLLNRERMAVERTPNCSLRNRYHMYFSYTNILPVVWICLGVAAICLIYLLTVYYLFIRIRYGRPKASAEDKLPGVSVIVYARDNATDLRSTLPEILGQDYPEDKMEVIVVNDGSVEDVTDVVNYLGAEHHNLYITFVPDDAHNLSRKKLAISLGVKAAHNEVVILTCAECHPASPSWLRQMATPFATRGAKVVLGWAYIAGLKSSALRFDQAARGVEWLSAAVHHHPYRGTGYNLAYTREAFFQAKGFSRSLNLTYGDDDIFINQIADGDNTSVVLSPDSIMQVEYKRPAAAYRDLRLRHCFTGRRLPKWSRRLMGSGTLAAWLWLAAVVTGTLFSLPNWGPASLLLATIPALWIPLTICWRRTGRVLAIKLSPALIWWNMLWRWCGSIKCALLCTKSSRHNYAWHIKR